MFLDYLYDIFQQIGCIFNCYYASYMYIFAYIYMYTYVCMYISERSSSTKLKLNESTSRNVWLSLRDTSPWRATNSEECDFVWHDKYFCFLARLASLLLKPRCIMIELGDTTRPGVDSSEPSEAVKK